MHALIHVAVQLLWHHCRAWWKASQSPLVWANASVVIRNPIWIRSLHGLRLAEGDGAIGAQIVKPRWLREHLAARGVGGALLAGPNVQHEQEHIAQLAVDMPALHTLTVYRCQLSAKSVAAVRKHMPTLDHLVIVGGWSARQLTALYAL